MSLCYQLSLKSVLSIFEWPFYTGFTVLCFIVVRLVSESCRSVDWSVVKAFFVMHTLYCYVHSLYLAGGKIFTASIGSVDSLYFSVFIFCLNLHQFLILCSSEAMMFVKLYFRTSDIYIISLVSLDPSFFHLRTK